MRIKDIRGQRFGRLTVVSVSDECSSHGDAMWMCKCDCGKHRLASGGSLRAGHVRSCGCLLRDINHARTREAKKTLTKDQAEILEMKFRGLENKQIAALRGIAEKSVEQHLNNMRRKVEARNTTELIYKALTRRSWLEVPKRYVD